MRRVIRTNGYHKKNYATYREYAMQAAQELGYGPEVVRKILNAKDDREIEHILATARNQDT